MTVSTRLGLVLLALACLAGHAGAACCYFSAKDKDVDQPSQKAFITWEPESKAETFTVQPKFAGNAVDFGMVIPTPSRPKLDEMPRDFFRHLALYTVLLPLPQRIRDPFESQQENTRRYKLASASRPAAGARNDHGVTVLEAGVVGSLDYKILEAERADGLYQWLRENGYSYSGDEKTLQHYIEKKWVFTAMKIDTKQMKKNADGSYAGEVTPTRFAFASDQLVYPLRITQISVKSETEALFYVQAPRQMDLKGNWSWAWSYRIMWLTSGTVCLSQKQMTQAEQKELAERQEHLAKIRQEIPEFDTTKLEWSAALDEKQLAVLDNPVESYGQGGFPDLPGTAKTVKFADMQADFTARVASAEDAQKQYATRYLDSLKERLTPERGTLVANPGADGKLEYHFLPARTAPADELAQLAQLKGHLKAGRHITKFRKKFLKHEMDLDLELVEVAGPPVLYQRILPQSPP